MQDSIVGAGVLALYPSTKGFAFVLFESALAPYDWAVMDVRYVNKNERTLELVKELIDKYRPESLVIEDYAKKACRRSARIRKLYKALSHLAETEYVDVFTYSRDEVRTCFLPVGVSTKHEMASAIAREIPAFINLLPHRRRACDDQDRNMGIFDATALAFTHYTYRMGEEVWRPERRVMD